MQGVALSYVVLLKINPVMLLKIAMKYFYHFGLVRTSTFPHRIPTVNKTLFTHDVIWQHFTICSID